VTFNINFQLNYKICIINCFWGEWPEWFVFFLESCKYNSYIDWFFFSDNYSIPLNSKNIHLVYFEKKDFSQLATHKLGFEIQITNPYKVCDFKPIYGKIFEDYLNTYEFWGYCDIDLIFGKINNFIDDGFFNKFDVISTYKQFLSGPFCLFRNNDKTNQLYQRIPDIKNILNNTQCFSFDENLLVIKPKIFVLKKIRFFFGYLGLLIKNFDLYSFLVQEFIYQFQWFLKRKNVNEINIHDMTDIVHFTCKKKELKTYFGGLMLSDVYFERINNRNWNIIWDQGVLRDNKGTELFSFHFRKIKIQTVFKITDPGKGTQKFEISNEGIRSV